MAATLSGLSEAVWHCYTHPANAAGSPDVNTDGWRREQTRNGFGSVVHDIRRPNLPYEHSSLLGSHIRSKTGRTGSVVAYTAPQTPT